MHEIQRKVKAKVKVKVKEVDHLVMIKHLQNAKIISLRWKRKSSKRRDMIQKFKKYQTKVSSGSWC